MKYTLPNSMWQLPPTRLLVAVALVGVLAVLRVVLKPEQLQRITHGGAENLAADLPAVTLIDRDPRKAFPSALGRAVTFGFDIESFHITILSWSDIDRANLRLVGAVLEIPKELFVAHPNYLGCDLQTYSRGRCRFDIDFLSGSARPIQGQSTLSHDIRTSDTQDRLSRHL